MTETQGELWERIGLFTKEARAQELEVSRFSTKAEGGSKDSKGGRVLPKESDTNLAWLVHQLPLWRLGKLQGRGGGDEGQQGPVAGAVEAGAFDLVVTGKRGVTIPTEQHGSRVSSHFTLVTGETTRNINQKEIQHPPNLTLKTKQNRNLTH